MPLSNGGITPGFLLNDARYNNSLSPYAYDPNMMVDPTAAIQMQQQYLKQMFAMQNPRLALPQQFGAALGAALSGQKAGGAQMPTQSQGPQTPVAQDVHQKYLANMKSGMDQGEALYKASQQSQMEGKFSDDPTAEKVYDKATTWALEKYKYDPNIGKAAKASAQQETENLVDQTGNIRAFRKGTPEWQQAVDSGQYKKASDTPQLTPGSLHEVKVGGMYNTYKVQPDGTMKLVGKSSQPMQYQVSGTPEQMAQGGLLGSTGTTAANDKNRKELADRQISTINALRGLDSISSTIDASKGTAVGTAGNWYEKGNNIVQTARNLAGNFNQQDLVDPMTYNWKGLDTVVGKVRGQAIDATKYHSQMVATAYMMAAAQSNNNTDEKMTRQRIEANLEMLAEHSDDPAAVKSALDSARSQLVNNFKTQAKVYDPTYQATALDEYEASRKPKTGPGPYTDAEKEKRYQAWKKSHNGG
jgi:hypothetical protein